LTKKNDVLKKTQRVTIALNMQKDSWNIINLHQVLNNGTLYIMELKKEKKMKIQFIMLISWFFKDIIL
jgi:hypothetical protein